MDDGSSNNSNFKNTNKNGLIKEWNLLWASLIEDEGFNQNQLESDKGDDDEMEDHTDEFHLLRDSEQITKLKKALSDKRKKINQKLESVQKETDLNLAKLESLKLVGGDIESVEVKINQLADLGQDLSDQLKKIDDKIKQLRNFESEIHLLK